MIGILGARGAFFLEKKHYVPVILFEHPSEKWKLYRGPIFGARYGSTNNAKSAVRQYVLKWPRCDGNQVDPVLPNHDRFKADTAGKTSGACGGEKRLVPEPIVSTCPTNRPFKTAVYRSLHFRTCNFFPYKRFITEQIASRRRTAVPLSVWEPSEMGFQKKASVLL